MNRMFQLIGLSRASFRLGRPDARDWLGELWPLVRGNDETFWLVQVAAVAAEGAWLTGDSSLVTDEVHQVYRRGLTDNVWLHGDLTAWLQRLGHEVDLVLREPAHRAVGDVLERRPLVVAHRRAEREHLVARGPS